MVVESFNRDPSDSLRSSEDEGGTEFLATGARRLSRVDDDLVRVGTSEATVFENGEFDNDGYSVFGDCGVSTACGGRGFADF